MEFLPVSSSNNITVGVDDSVTTSFQHPQNHYHMLILKLQRHTIGIKDSRKLESSKCTKTKTTKSNTEKNDRSKRRLLAFKMMQSMSMLIQSTSKVFQSCKLQESKFFVQLPREINIIQHGIANHAKMKLFLLDLDLQMLKTIGTEVKTSLVFKILLKELSIELSSARLF
ncbi:hypothetical protein Tco_0356716 [Tanacetum coccineum]